MNLLDIYNKMYWAWKGKQTPLKDLHENQLQHIKSFVKKYKSNHYGYTSEAWIKAIDCILTNRQKNDVIDLHNIVSARREKKLTKAMDTVVLDKLHNYKQFIG